MSSSSSDAESSSDSSAGSSSEEKDDKKRKKCEKEVLVSSDSDSDSDSDSSDDDEEPDKKKQKKDKKDKKKKKGKDKKKKDKKKKANKDKKGKKKEKKGKDKKSKKKAKRKKRLEKAKREAVSTQFGKYGVIKPEDFYNKKPEFLSWAMEVKKENTDTMGQMEMKNLFKEYIEDYNTATMPTKKYYNLQAWDTLMSKKRQQKKRGDEMSDAQKAALASFDDEKARREEIKHLQAKKQDDYITSEVKKMRANKAKVEEMKTQERLRTQMDMLNKAGLSKEATKIKDRLTPD